MNAALCVVKHLDGILSMAVCLLDLTPGFCLGWCAARSILPDQLLYGSWTETA